MRSILFVLAVTSAVHPLRAQEKPSDIRSCSTLATRYI